MSLSTAIVPFWHRLPVFFAFPLQSRNLVTLAAFSLGWLIVGVMPGGLLGGLLKLLMAIGLIGGFSRYWFNVLDQTAYGCLDSSEYAAHKLNGHDDALIKLLFTLLVQSAVLWFVLGGLGPAGQIVAAALSSLITPATVMLITLSGSVLSSLNPLTLIAVMLRIGSPYLLLYAFLFMLQVGAGTVLVVAMPWLPVILMPPAIAFCLMFSALIMAQMMGYVLYQNHGELGLETRREKLTPEEVSAAAMEGLDDRIQQFLDDNNFAAAVDVMRDAVKEAPDDMARHERYHRLLVLANDARLQRHAQEYIGRLLTARQPLVVLKVLEACWRQQADWRPEVHLCLPLARLCFERGRVKDAVRLLKDFHRRYPDSTDIPEALLLQARILIEHYEKHEQAQPFLKALQSRYPGHSASVKAEALLRGIA